MTEKLYDQNAYLKEFDATVLKCDITADGKYEVILDRTAFFPEEGGQTPDRGLLNGARVLDVQISGGEIIHYLDVYQTEGTVVHCNVDWDYRFTNMQMHSGEHVFSGIINSKFGLNNVGFHLSDNSATCDYDGKLSEQELKEAEELVNRVIWDNHIIKTYYPDSILLESLNYRSKSGIEGQVRLVEIEDVDLCACCAPHVSSTAEIGIFKIVSFENYKGGIRVNFLCGKRAFEDYGRLNELETVLSRSLNAKKDDIAATVERLKSSIAKLEYSNISLRRMRVSCECENLQSGMVFLTEEDSDLLRFAMGELKSNFCGLCIAFAGNDDDGYKFIAECDGQDINKLLEKLKLSFEIRGGGRNGSIQGSINGKRDQLSLFMTDIGFKMFEN